MEFGKRLPNRLEEGIQKMGSRPPRSQPPRFETVTTGGCLASIAHAVISWTLAKKEDMMSKDDETFRRVLAGLQKGKAPTQAEREEAKRRLAQGQAQVKAQKAREERVKKLRKRGRDDDNVIDTGMFGS